MYIVDQGCVYRIIGDLLHEIVEHPLLAPEREAYQRRRGLIAEKLAPHCLDQREFYMRMSEADAIEPMLTLQYKLTAGIIKFIKEEYGANYMTEVLRIDMEPDDVENHCHAEEGGGFNMDTRKTIRCIDCAPMKNSILKQYDDAKAEIDRISEEPTVVDIRDKVFDKPRSIPIKSENPVQQTAGADPEYLILGPNGQAWSINKDIFDTITRSLPENWNLAEGANVINTDWSAADVSLDNLLNEDEMVQLAAARFEEPYSGGGHNETVMVLVDVTGDTMKVPHHLAGRVITLITADATETTMGGVACRIDGTSGEIIPLRLSEKFIIMMNEDDPLQLDSNAPWGHYVSQLPPTQAAAFIESLAVPTWVRANDATGVPTPSVARPANLLYPDDPLSEIVKELVTTNSTVLEAGETISYALVKEPDTMILVPGSLKKRFEKKRDELMELFPKQAEGYRMYDGDGNHCIIDMKVAEFFFTEDDPLGLEENPPKFGDLGLGYITLRRIGKDGMPEEIEEIPVAPITEADMADDDAMIKFLQGLSTKNMRKA